MARGQGTLVKYGKVEILADASLDEVINKLDMLLKDHGYPEEEQSLEEINKELLKDELEEESESEPISEDDVEDLGLDVDEKDDVAPWETAKRKLNGRKDLQEE